MRGSVQESQGPGLGPGRRRLRRCFRSSPPPRTCAPSVRAGGGLASRRGRRSSACLGSQRAAQGSGRGRPQAGLVAAESGPFRESLGPGSEERGGRGPGPTLPWQRASRAGCPARTSQGHPPPPSPRRAAGRRGCMGSLLRERVEAGEVAEMRLVEGAAPVRRGWRTGLWRRRDSPLGPRARRLSRSPGGRGA